MERPRGLTRDELTGATAIHAEARSVRFQDVDAAGIIFFPKILEYFHDAFMAMLAAAGLDLKVILADGSWGMPLIHAEADYLRPLRFGDPIVVEIAVVRLGDRSVTIGHRAKTSD